MQTGKTCIETTIGEARENANRKNLNINHYKVDPGICRQKDILFKFEP
jgi:hypothetical protein